ncbi:MAG: transglutaminase family protein, partial [Pseudorhodoplanes sp.]
EFDPTNGIVGNTDLIRVAIAREPRQAIPLWGSYTGSPSDHLEMKVNIRVVSEAGA